MLWLYHPLASLACNVNGQCMVPVLQHPHVLNDIIVFLCLPVD